MRVQNERTVVRSARLFSKSVWAARSHRQGEAGQNRQKAAAGLATFRARKRLRKLEAREAYVQSRHPSLQGASPSIAATRKEIDELASGMRDRRTETPASGNGGSFSRAAEKRRFRLRIWLGALVSVLVPTTALAAAAAFAGWEFTSWFILEYAVALLILACLSVWALTKPRRKSVRLR